MTAGRAGAVVASACALGLAAASGAQSQTPRFSVDVHAIFSGGQASNFSAGQPLQVTFVDRRRTVSLRQVCWSPAPVARPSCSASRFGAPRAAGTQRVTLRLSNGRSLSTSFRVRAARRQIASSIADGRVIAVPVQMTCASALYGNVNRRGATLGTVAAGRFVAAYYRANAELTQVWSYNLLRAGFVASSCVGQPNGTTG